MSKGGTSPGPPVESQGRWRTAGELLQAGQYELVIEILLQAQVASEQADDAILAHTLGAARRICLACRQCQAEAEWHRRGYEQADQREHELRRQIHIILDLIGGREVLETSEKREELAGAPPVEMSLPERGPPEPVARLSLWQRIQSLLRQGPDSRSPEREAPVVSAEVPPSLAVYCLGPFRVYQNDKLITAWNGLKGQCILKYLVAHRGRPTAKDILMDLFWPDADPEAARRNLHQAIYSLRQTLRQGHPEFQHVQFENDCYLLNPEVGVWIDGEEFKKHIQAGRRLEAAGRLAEAMAEYGIAEGLYQGDFLEEDLYEDWPRLQREQMRNMYLDIVDRLSECYVQQDEYTAAIALCHKVLVQDSCYETAHRRLMRCYLAQGQRHLAVRQYQTCVETLRQELDLAPSEETVVLYRRITTA